MEHNFDMVRSKLFIGVVSLHTTAQQIEGVDEGGSKVHQSAISVLKSDFTKILQICLLCIFFSMYEICSQNLKEAY